MQNLLTFEGGKDQVVSPQPSHQQVDSVSEHSHARTELQQQHDTSFRQQLPSSNEQSFTHHSTARKPEQARDSLSELVVAEQLARPMRLNELSSIQSPQVQDSQGAVRAVSSPSKNQDRIFDEEDSENFDEVQMFDVSGENSNITANPQNQLFRRFRLRQLFQTNPT